MMKKPFWLPFCVSECLIFGYQFSRKYLYFFSNSGSLISDSSMNIRLVCLTAFLGWTVSLVHLTNSKLTGMEFHKELQFSSNFGLKFH